MNKVEDNNEKYREIYRDFELSMVKDIEDSLQELRLRPSNVETKVAYEQRMYSLVLRQLNPIQKGVQTTHGVVEYANKYASDEEYRRWAETDKTLIMLDGGVKKDMESIFETLTELGVKFGKFQEPDLNYITTSITFLADERVWNREQYPSWETLPQCPCTILGGMPTPDPKDYMSYNEWVEMMGGAANVELRNLIFSKKLSM